MSIISVSGRINSGKDTVGSVIQYLTSNKIHNQHLTYNEWLEFYSVKNGISGWKIVKYADKLKDFVCLLIGCTREQLEDQDFKNKVLPEEWDKFAFYRENTRKPLRIYSSREEAEKDVQIFKGGKVEILKMTPRLLLQVIGTECIRDKVHPNCWVNALFAGYKPIITTESFYDEKANNYTGITNKSTTSFPNWIITDTRFPNEYKAIKDKGGICIKITRKVREFIPGFVAEYNPLLDGKEHESETALDHISDWDYVINNDGTIDDLIEKVKIILQKENKFKIT